ncbi:MAG: hypothetical protein NTZ56_05235 [Acidobacteria bacterium]|nr:hypothetical protein [Acidobacteriota bacterium]
MKRSLFVYGALIFFSGLAVGALGQRLYSATTVTATVMPPRPDDWRRQFMQEMTERVHLDSKQVSELHTVLDESKTLFDQVRDKYKPEMKAIYDSQVDKIRQMLKADQKPLFEALRLEREARRKAAEKSAR